MTTVSIYVGQCGNQIGHQLDQVKLHNELTNLDGKDFHYDYHSEKNKRLKEKEHQNSYDYETMTRRLKKYRNTIMIDTEMKVVGKLDKVQCKMTTNRGRSKHVVTRAMRENNIICGKRGRGNNWALGYEGIGTENILEQAMESIRKEAERCDTFSNIFLMHSLCGGTGGGLGSRLLETLRGEFRLEHIMSCVVAPFLTGDTPLQHYNALLSLTALQKFSDAVLLFKNDMISSHCGSSSSDGRPAPAAVSYTQMNNYVAQCLAGITTPTDTLTPIRGYGCGLELSEVVRSICPQPSLKFLTTNHVSRATDDVKATCNAVVNLTKKENMGTKCHSLSNVAVIRGPQTEVSSHIILPAMEQRVKKELRTVGWNPFPIDYWLASQSLAGGKAGCHSATLISNYSNIIPYADHVWVRAKQMFEQKAYLHWYYKHGLSQDYFEEAFNTVDEIIHNYTEAIK